MLTYLLVLKVVYSVSDIHHFLHSLCRWLFKQFSKVAPQTSLDIAFGPCLKCLGTTAVFPCGLTISNEEVRLRSDQPPLTHIICTSRVKFFGYIAHAQSNPQGQLGLTTRRLHRPFGRPCPSLTLHNSTLARQLPVIGHRTDVRGAFL